MAEGRRVERYGDFELQRLIATGGMAEIYLAKHGGGFGGLSRLVVVKRMLPQLAVRPDFVQMFLDEARLAANLNHPNIVSVFNLGEVDNSYFIAMEFVDGPHLGSLFAHSLRLRKPLPIDQCVYIVARAADGLHYAHEQDDPATGSPLHLVHRDISPQNILVSRIGEVKVTDFGVAKASTQQTKTRTGIIKGKVAYMSPEQCLGDDVDKRTDVFAMGIVLYELLTRRRLFRDKSDLLIMQKITGEDVQPPSAVNKDIDGELDAICKRALARDREQRYSSAAELAEALDAWLVGKISGDPRVSLQRWFEQNALELAIGASVEMSEGHTAQLRPAPGEQTAATPSLNSAETVMRPSSPEISAPAAISRPSGSSGSSGAGSGPAAARPAMTPGATTNPNARPAAPTDPGRDRATGLPDRGYGHGEDEPTQRAPRPQSARRGANDASDDASDDADTLYGVAPTQGADLDGGPTDEGIAVTSSPPAPGFEATASQPAQRVSFATDPSASVARPLPAKGNGLFLAAGIGIGIVAVIALVVMFSSNGAVDPTRTGVVVDADSGDKGNGDKGNGDKGNTTGEEGNTPPVPNAAGDAAKGKIHVESVPPGINVMLDEERIVGKTPLDFEHAPGVIKLQAQFRDQPPVDVEIDVKPGEERAVRMLARTSLIVKSSPPRAKVKVNGEVVGETPFERKAVVEPEKPVKIKLELAGYDFPEKTLTPEAGVPLDLGEIAGRKRGGDPPPPPPPAKFGLLNMRSAPWVQVKVRGQLLGNTTFTQIRVPAGRQTLVMTNPEVGINETLVVTIPEDKTLNINLEWEKKGNDWRIKTRSIK